MAGNDLAQGHIVAHRNGEGTRLINPIQLSLPLA